MTSVVIGRGMVLLQINAEGISKAKTEIITHLATKNGATVILLQEAHATKADVLSIPGYNLTAHTISGVHGIATFVHSSAKWHDVASSAHDDEIEWTTTEVEGVTITNVYKPPGTRLNVDSLPRTPPPCIYAGDFNCHSTTWGYRNTNPDGTILEDWASASNLALLHDPKQPDSFCSARWGTTTNPDLAFTNIGALTVNRRVLEPFPKSQHRPSIIESSASINSVPTRLVKRWNFRKANWEKFTEPRL